MHTYSFHPRLPQQVLGISLAVVGLAGVLATTPARASDLECLIDDEAVVLCEAIWLSLEHRLKPRQATCIENCAVCGLQDLTEFETN